MGKSHHYDTNRPKIQHPPPDNTQFPHNSIMALTPCHTHLFWNANKNCNLAALDPVVLNTTMNTLPTTAKHCHHQQTNIIAKCANLHLLPKVHHHHIYILKTNQPPIQCPRPAVTQFPHNPIIALTPHCTLFFGGKCKKEFQTSSTQLHSPNTPHEPMSNDS